MVLLKIPQLRITQRMAEIAIDRREGYLKISSPQSQFDLNYNNSKQLQVVGDIKIDNPPAKLDIDQTKCLEEVGYRKTKSHIRHLTGQAEQRTWEGIAKIVSEGEFLAQIEKGSNQIVQLAKQKMNDSQKRFAIRSIPSSSPEINVQTYPIKVQVNQARIQVESSFSYPQVDFKADRLEIYLAQKGELQIDIVGGSLNYRA